MNKEQLMDAKEMKVAERYFGDEDKIVIKDHYDHRNDPWTHEISQKYPSIYIMFDTNFRLHWCPSGNELRRLYLENPSGYLSEPIYTPIPRYMSEKIKNMIDNY